MKNVQEHTAQLAKIPQKTWKEKLFRTLAIAPASLGIAYFIKRWGWFADFEIWKIDQNVIVLGLILFAGYSAAGDVLRGFTGYVIAALKDLKGVFSK